MKFEKICVLGLGYVGLPTASTFATYGMKVVGVDVNRRVIDTLQNGEIHIHEPGLRTLVQAAFGSGNLVVMEKPEPADAFVIAVPTPIRQDKTADLDHVLKAAESIIPYLQVGNLVVLESTSPPRTTVEIIAPILERSGLKAGQDFYLAYSPERVLPGQILRELVVNDRVVGGITPSSSKAGRELYSTFVRGNIVLTDATTAEMVKLMENTYRDVNIAIANEFSRLADRLGVNVWEAIELANRHPRVQILRPGPGVGGHCVSVDPWFLVQSEPELTPLIQTARRVNDTQPDYVVELVRWALNGRKEGSVAILGLAYKADVDDLRESPAIHVAEQLSKTDFQVFAYEPFGVDFDIPGVHVVPTLEAALKSVDVVALLVRHTKLVELEPDWVASHSPARILVDAVNGWKPEPWEAAGFRLVRLGGGINQPIPPKREASLER